MTKSRHEYEPQEHMRMGTNEERQVILQEIAGLMSRHWQDGALEAGGVIANKIEQKVVAPGMPEELKDDDTPFFALLRNAYNNFLIHQCLIESDPGAAYLYETWTHGVARDYYQTSVLSDAEDGLDILRRKSRTGNYREGLTENSRQFMRQLAERRALRYAITASQRNHNEDGNVDFRAIITAAYVAFNNYQAIDTKHSKNSVKEKQKTLDIAMGHLKQVAGEELTQAEQHMHEAFDHYIHTNSRGELSDEALARFNNKIMPILAKQQAQQTAQGFVEFFGSEEIDASRCRREMQAVRALREELRELKEIKDSLIDLEAVDTDWVILPPNLDEIMHGQGRRKYFNSGYEVDYKRIADLIKVVKAWGSGYIAVSKLEGTGPVDCTSAQNNGVLPGDNEYYAAILPDTIIVDGVHTEVEHAVADNPTINRNACFVWRAERNPSITWKDVFRNDRPSAKALGARRMVHTKHFAGNLLEYLTRPPSKLSLIRSGYRR